MIGFSTTVYVTGGLTQNGGTLLRDQAGTTTIGTAATAGTDVYAVAGGVTISFALAAGVRRLAMFHHDPMRSDRELDALYDQVAEIVRDDQEPPLIAREGLEVVLDSS